MINRKPIFFLILLLFAVDSLYSQESFFAGMAKINITPSTPIRMSGYGNRDNPFSGVHDSIYATAMALGIGMDKAVLISADVVGFSHDYVDAIKEKINRETGIRRGDIQVIATHNHGGPVTSVYTDQPNETELQYFETLKNKLSEVVRNAIENMVPARIGIGKGICRMNINRRARHAEGGIWLGRNPDGPCDHGVTVIRLDNAKQEPIGALVDWPCHGTVSGQDNTHITGDWPGSAAAHFGAALQIPVMVTAGASADINPIYGPNSKFNDIEAIGQLVAEEAVGVFSNIRTYQPQEITSITTVVKSPGKKRSDSRLPGVSLEPGEDQMLRLVTLKIGPVVIAGISGELMTEIGQDIVSRSPFKNTLVISHCNGNNGYLCTDEAYQEGGYEPMVSRTMPGTALLIRDNFEIMFNKL